MNEKELPMLAWIAGALRWLEELITILSGPLLTAGLAIALVDLLTDGKLLASQPALLYAWAVSQAIGVDGQLVGAAVKAGRAARSGRWRHALAYGVLIAALGYVAYLASNVFATQQALGLTTAQALARLGMGDTNWIVTRSLLAVVLVILSGALRYDPPKIADSAASERERLQAELELEPLRAQLRARKALGWRDVGRAVIGGAAAKGTAGDSATRYDGSQPASMPTIPNSGNDTLQATPAPTQTHAAASAPDPEDFPPEPPDGPSSPNGRTHARRPAESFAEDFRQVPALQVVPSSVANNRASARKTKRNNALRAQAFALLDQDPGLSKSALRAALRCRQTTADSMYSQWRASQRQWAAR